MSRVLALAMTLLALWAVGMGVFVRRLPAPGAAAPTGDAVAVYTGGGNRIAAGLRLLGDGAGDRLLVSGVHPDTRREDVAALGDLDPARFRCCVDLGRAAGTTAGNAEELAVWAEGRGFRRVVLVTAEYHMPRALLVTRRRLPPDVAVIPYPVKSGALGPRGWPVDLRALRLIAGEYTKFLAAWASGLGR